MEMKHLCITYHMERPSEIAESCITLPMESAVADDLMAHGDDSLYMAPGGAISTILERLSEVQGYTFIGVCTAAMYEK